MLLKNYTLGFGSGCGYHSEMYDLFIEAIMVNIQYDFDIEGALREDPFLDSYEIALMFEQTKQSMGQALERKLENITCDEHVEPPTIIISGRYDTDAEQMNVSYHIDTCCKLFMVRVVKILNTVN